MKKIIKEFKAFITRGNVIDLAVGVIIGSAFTAIVTALTKNILQPVINWIIYAIFGGNGSMEGVYTFLVGNASDLENAIYIDWGALISSIINFFLIALVLFLIVKAVNRINEKSNKVYSDIKKSILTKEDKRELKKQGIKLYDKKSIKAYIEKRDEEKRLKDEDLKKETEEKAKKEREENPTEIDLLKDIKELLKNK